MGLVNGACMATNGAHVTCIDIDKEKIDKLNNGELPIYEELLEPMVKFGLTTGRLKFTTDYSSVNSSTLIFICVGTPEKEDGSADLKYVFSATKNIIESIHGEHECVVVVKSTVPVGTTDKVKEMIDDVLGSHHSVHVAFNPEFLKEGTAVNDCMRPDRIVIGVDNEEAAETMRELYRHYVLNTENFILMDIASAEMTKYAANSMLATKISFMNEISRICEAVGADVNKVRKGIGSDKRIGYSFIYPGCGYGGSCFPKDVKALVRTAAENGYEAQLLSAVEDVNYMQKHVLTTKVKEHFGSDLSGKTFAVWGLAFKPDTDDMREASAITLINDLTSAGAKVQAYDPKAMEEAKKCYLKGNDAVTYVEGKYEALKGADALILVTEWKEFRSPDFDEIKKALKTPVIFDGRNIYGSKVANKYGFDYYQIGVRASKADA